MSEGSRTRLIVGAGYLGRVVAERWRASGDLVYATTRSANHADELRAAGLRPILWNVLESVGELPAADVVLYAVGFDRSAGVSQRAVYVDGLRRTLTQLGPTGRIIYISSTGVWGSTAQGAWVTEETPAEPADPSGEACLEAETVLREVATERGTPWVILRLAGIYGPGRMVGVADLKANRPIAANPEAHVNWIHVADAATVVQAAADRGTPGRVYIVSDGRPVKRRDYYEWLANQIGAPAPTFDPAASRRHRGDRKLDHHLMMRDLAPNLRFADYRQGLIDALER